jgi:hypothetical protein
MKIMDSFHYVSFIAVNCWLLMEMISFFMGDVKMAVVFRVVILLTISNPILQFMFDSPFAYCFNQSQFNKLLLYVMMEDSFIFLLIRQGSQLFYYLSLVYTPLIILVYITNKEFFHALFIKYSSYNLIQQSPSMV